MSTPSSSRRSFLKLAAGTAALSASPWIWVKKARSEMSPGFGRARHVLILYAGGGLRSAPLFNADVSFQLNPFGSVPRADTNTEWGVGKILGTDAQPIYSFGQDATLPPVSAIAKDVAVLAGVDHDPSAPLGVMDHGSGDLRLTGGALDTPAGLLSVIHHAHPGYKNGTILLPPIDI